MAGKKMTAAEKAEAERQKMIRTLKAIAENYRERENSIVNQLSIGWPDYPVAAEENEKATTEEEKAMPLFEETIRKLGENYEHMEGSIVNQLFMQTPAHPPTTGSYRETVWQALLRQIIPQKFCIDQGVFIIDAHKHISKEVDLAVFDEQYTPYIFNYGKMKFIPIEAVAMVVQCKSKNVIGLGEQLKEWTKSILRLMPSFDAVARTASDLLINDIDHPGIEKSKGRCTQTATRPILMLCAAADDVDDKVRNLFDIILIKSKQGTALQKFIPNEERDLSCWYEELNHHACARYDKGKEVFEQLKKQVNETGRTLKELRVGEKSAEENIILSLVFQLNQLLMLLNNPMLFPHRAYAKMFNDILKTGQPAEAEGGPAHG